MKIKPVIILIMVMMLGSACAISACKTSKVKANSPEVVAKKFLGHLSMYEFDECRALGTENTGRMMDMLQVMLEMSKEKGKLDSLQKKDHNITIVKTAIDGKFAVVTYVDENGKEQMLNMVKEDGKWLVDMKKETPSGH